MRTFLVATVLTSIATWACADEQHPPRANAATSTDQPTAPTVRSIADGVEAADVGDFHISIDRVCRLTANSAAKHETQFRIDLPGDCRLVLTKTGEAQIVRTRRGLTILVISSKPLPVGRFCDSRLRAVVVSAKGEILVSKTQQRIRLCARGPYDEKMFHTLALDLAKPE
jgi:hypothetical protein